MTPFDPMLAAVILGGLAVLATAWYAWKPYHPQISRKRSRFNHRRRNHGFDG